MEQTEEKGTGDSERKGTVELIMIIKAKNGWKVKVSCDPNDKPEEYVFEGGLVEVLIRFLKEYKRQQGMAREVGLYKKPVKFREKPISGSAY